MKNKIDIEKLKRGHSFTVPDDYFNTLTHSIMDKVDNPKKAPLFSLNTLTPAMAVIALLFMGIWFNTTQTNGITNDDLIEVLAYYQIEDELLYEYIELEEESFEEDDYLIDEYDYNELIYEL